MSPKKKTAPKGDLEQKLAAAEAARVRLAADYANLERRIAEEREQIRSTAAAAVLEKLFPIFDNFYRASAHAPIVNLQDLASLTEEDFRRMLTYFQGLKMIEKQMEEVLRAAGLERIQAKGGVFNPELHEAISYEQNPNTPSDHVIDETEAGWTLNGKVIRPAKVRVSQG